MVTAHDMSLLVYFTIFIIVIIASHTAGYILRIVSTISIAIIYC